MMPTRIDLAGMWELTSDMLDTAIPMEIPGDVYSALLTHGVLPDPFYADNERRWVPYARATWSITHTFVCTDARVRLEIAMVDTIARIYINDTLVAKSESMFVPLALDIGHVLHAGDNTIRIDFLSAEATAERIAQGLRYPVPYSEFPIQSAHRNLVRKAQCHGGWDWGPALMTAGVYRAICLNVLAEYAVCAYHCDIRQDGSAWMVEVHIEIDARSAEEVAVSAVIAGANSGAASGAYAHISGEQGAALGVREQGAALGVGERGAALGVGGQGAALGVVAQETRAVFVKKGSQVITMEMRVEEPELWWPAAHGAQTHYRLMITVGELQYEKMIAFRTVDIVSEADTYGKSFWVTVNGRTIMIRGANWIPCDALPLRQSDARVGELLESARAANINMLRVWGGGQYESAYFYRRCSELGILVWQDFMFSCALYPSDRAFLDLVRAEARAQIVRLKDFPCVALWCGNNENVGALTWYKESIENRDRYVIDYDRLNEGVLGAEVRRCDPCRVFWPSSPSGGDNDYRANWHDDRNGDMHFWSVWHEGKPFENYYSVIPRFCSEFGFQSFASLRSARTFVAADALNPTHPDFEHHQRHPQGNSIILETIGRYFRFPKNFENMLYLSQLQQGLAIKTAVEYWRAHPNRCGGMMYWQLNDLWPGASWSSIEYGGYWKLLHYFVRRFYRPLHIAAFRDPHTKKVVIMLYNDGAAACTVRVSCTWRKSDGVVLYVYRDIVMVDAGAVRVIADGAAVGGASAGNASVGGVSVGGATANGAVAGNATVGDVSAGNASAGNASVGDAVANGATVGGVFAGNAAVGGASVSSAAANGASVSGASADGVSTCNVSADGATVGGVSVGGATVGGASAHDAAAHGATVGGVSAGNASAHDATAGNASVGGVSAGNASAGNASANGVSVGGASANGVSVGGASADDASANGAAAGNASVGGMSADGATVGGATVGGVSAGNASANGASVGGATAGNASANGVSVGGASVGGVSADGVSVGGASVGGASVGGASVGGVSADGVSVGGASVGGASVGGASVGGASIGGASADGVSVGDASAGNAAADGATVGGASADGAFAGNASANGVLVGGGAAVGGVSAGNASVGGASADDAAAHDAAVGGAFVDGVSVSGASIGGAAANGASAGNAFVGGATAGNTAAHDAAAGNASVGGASAHDASAGNASVGGVSAGNASAHDATAGNASVGGVSAGNASADTDMPTRVLDGRGTDTILFMELTECVHEGTTKGARIATNDTRAATSTARIAAHDSRQSGRSAATTASTTEEVTQGTNMTSNDTERMVRNVFLYSTPKQYTLATATISITNITRQDSLLPPPCFPHANCTYALEITSSHIVLYLTLQLQEHFSCFSDNAFSLQPNERRVIFCYVDSAVIGSAAELRNNIVLFDVARSGMAG